MTLQARLSEGDPRLYNPSRDIAHNFKSVMELVADRMEDGTWPELNKHLKDNEITMDDLGEACGAYCKYVGLSVESKETTMKSALTDAGWFECKPLAQMAVLSLMGTVIAGIHFKGVREATFDDGGPAHTVPELIATGDKCITLMRTPRWKRRLSAFWDNFRIAINALRGKNK